MQTKMTEEKSILRDLGDGLLLRTATKADAEALSIFNAKIHSDRGPENPDAHIERWTLDLFEKPHPTFKTSDFTIVENTKSEEIVSSMNLISQTWSYGGITFGVGRPELVGTLPEFRNRGLVRAQFDVIHQWSAGRGEKMQAITGIPYYYRLFGYEMGLSLGGGRLGYRPHVPKLKEGHGEPNRIRPATEADLTFVADLYQGACQRYVVNCVRDETMWRYELCGKSDRNINRQEIRLIETNDGEPVGYLTHPISTRGPSLVAMAYELKPGVSWGAVTPPVIRYLYATGESYAARDGNQAEFGAFGFWLGTEHPVYQVLHNALPHVRKPYAWFVRLPDLPGFLRHVAPALEQRLYASPFAGHSAELKITFYLGGLLLAFEAGRLIRAEPWKPIPEAHSGEAAFPDLTFLQLLFGYRSLEELNYAFADCWCKNDETFGLLNALFPKQVSNVWPVS